MNRTFAAVTLVAVYPHLATVQRELVASGFNYADEFEAGLDIVLGAVPDASSP